jgi:S-adenosylmethionine/arginine decarboxylase-like enzyme
MSAGKVLHHKHLIVRAEVRRPIVDAAACADWLRRLIADLGMNIMIGPEAVYSDMEGNRGVTGFAVITTSHVAIHIWDEVAPALVQLDVYTCGAHDPSVILRHIEEMEPVKVEHCYFDRENGLKELTSGTRLAAVA